MKKAKAPEDCLLREAREETGLTLTDYRLRGVLTFICDTLGIRVHFSLHGHRL